MLSVGFALLYWLGDRGAGLEFPSVLLLLAKGFAIWLLIAAVIINRRPGWAILTAGLVAHSAGDLALDSTSILLAIGFFLLGHLAYLVAFLRRSSGAWCLARLISAVLIALLGAIALWVLLPRLPQTLQIVVPFYVAVIVAMAVSAQRWPLPIALGAWAYIISDSLIGWSRFVGSIGFAAVLTWPLYYLAQFLITLHWRRHSAPPGQEDPSP